MTYEVVITPRAEQEAQANRDWWAQNRSAEQAARWYDEFFRAALSLEENPQRCALAAENGRFPYEVRQLNFGVGHKSTHRLFTIRTNDGCGLAPEASCPGRNQITVCHPTYCPNSTDSLPKSWPLAITARRRNCSSTQFSFSANATLCANRSKPAQDS